MSISEFCLSLNLFFKSNDRYILLFGMTVRVFVFCYANIMKECCILGEQYSLPRRHSNMGHNCLKEFALRVRHFILYIFILVFVLQELCWNIYIYKYLLIYSVYKDWYQSNWCLTKEENWEVVFKLRNVLSNGKPPTWFSLTWPIRPITLDWLLETTHNQNIWSVLPR